MNGHKPTDESVKVLLASDGSIAALVAESWVVHGRWTSTPEVEVIAVAGPPISTEAWLLPSAPISMREGIITARRREEAVAQDIADEVAARIRAAGISVTGCVRSGDPGVEILKRVEEVKPTLVAMGGLGRSDLDATLLGSVTQQLAAHSRWPVLIARPSGMTAGEIPQRVLVVIEAGPWAGAAVHWLAGQGWLRGSRVTLLGLLGTTAGLGADGPAPNDDLAEGAVTGARESLAQLLDVVAQDTTDASIELRFGHPLQACLEVADSVGADLVALASHARPPGSYPLADKLARYMKRSVLLVPVA